MGVTNGKQCAPGKGCTWLTYSQNGPQNKKTDNILDEQIGSITP